MVGMMRRELHLDSARGPWQRVRVKCMLTGCQQCRPITSSPKLAAGVTGKKITDTNTLDQILYWQESRSRQRPDWVM